MKLRAFRNKKLILGWVASAFISSMLVACYQQPPQKQGEVTEEVAEISVEKLYNHKVQYVGNHIEVINLIDNLPFAKEGLKKDGIELFTSQKPYRLVVNYMVEDREAYFKAYSEIDANHESKEQVLEDAISTTPFLKDAYLMLALIDNVDEIEIRIHDKEPYEGAVYSFKVTRQELQTAYGEDLSQTTKDLEDFKDLYHWIEAFPLDSNKQKN